MTHPFGGENYGGEPTGGFVVEEVWVADARPGEEVVPGSIKPAKGGVEEAPPIEDKIAALLGEMGYDVKSHFPPYRPAGNVAIKGFEDNPLNDPKVVARIIEETAGDGA